MSSYLMASVVVFMLGITGDSSDASKSTFKWVQDYGQAKREAQTAHRPMLIVIENSAEQSGRLDDKDLARSEETQETLKRFALCRVDVATEYGKKVAEAFGAEKYPYAAVSDAESKRIVFRGAGRMTDAQWRQALAASQPQVAQPYTVQKVVVNESVAQAGTSGTVTHGTPVYDSGTPVYSSGPVFQQWMGPAIPADCPSCRLRSRR